MKVTLLFVFAMTLMTSCKYTESPSAALSKEMCSCLFVAEQTEKYCRMVTKESRILANWEADFNRKEVTARGANFRAMSKLDDNPRYGCQIQFIEVDPEANDVHDQAFGRD
ncbi:MAG: hypothetical protein NXH75_03405 [Halobacteriovoraceae bacterium]|nr:hypothetical protein [Halobacteriovoraceae bacterium]